VDEEAMQNESRQPFWESIYTRKSENEVSWFQENPAVSLELIAQVGAIPSSAIIDIGGGTSRLVDNLIKRGFEDVTVLDLSEAAKGPTASVSKRLGESLCMFDLGMCVRVFEKTRCSYVSIFAMGKLRRHASGDPKSFS
jgi:hypothetical protein